MLESRTANFKMIQTSLQVTIVQSVFLFVVYYKHKNKMVVWQKIYLKLSNCELRHQSHAVAKYAPKNLY